MSDAQTCGELRILWVTAPPFRTKCMSKTGVKLRFNFVARVLQIAPQCKSFFVEKLLRAKPSVFKSSSVILCVKTSLCKSFSV